MTYDEIISLGWKDRHTRRGRDKVNTFVFEAPGYDYHIMSAILNYEEGLDQLMIKCVPEETKSNEWENSECHFYGLVKTSTELEKLMMQLGIIEYKNEP